MGIIIALIWQRSKQLQRFVLMAQKATNDTDSLQEAPYY